MQANDSLSASENLSYISVNIQYILNPCSFEYSLVY